MDCMALVRFASKIWRIINKGILVIKRDGLVGGLKRGYGVYKLTQKTTIQSQTNLSLFQVKGMRLEKKGKTLIFRPLAFPSVSVIIPVLNGLDFVQDCINSLYASPVDTSFEIIAIDQNSTDGTKEFLRITARNHENFVLVENIKNLGFAQAMNQGAARAKGAYLVLANSDLIFTPHWLDPLVKVVESDARVAIVSPLTNYVGEGPQVDPPARELKPENAVAYALTIADRQNEIPVTDRLVFFCVLLKKNFYDLMGGLANIYALGNYEDDDFCLRTRLAGYSLKIASNSFVYHLGSKTFKKQKINYTDSMINNEKIFFQRTVDFSLGKSLTRLSNPAAPQISVIVRTKNRPHLLKQALQCLANQTETDFETILINDGEISVQALVDSFTSAYPIRLVQNTIGAGRPNALNKGLEISQGKWITYLDDDDLLYPTHLENLVTAARRNPEAKLIYSDANKALTWIDSRQENTFTIARERFAQRDFSYEELLIDNWIPIMSYLHTRTDALSIHGYDETLEVFEDWDFLLRLTENAQVVRVPRITCEYRMRFGPESDDSTLVNREKAFTCRQEIYRRYPARTDHATGTRNVILDIVKNQMEAVNRIQQLPETTIQKNYILALTLGAFKSVDETIKIQT